MVPAVQKNVKMIRAYLGLFIWSQQSQQSISKYSIIIIQHIADYRSSYHIWLLYLIVIKLPGVTVYYWFVLTVYLYIASVPGGLVTGTTMLLVKLYVPGIDISESQ